MRYMKAASIGVFLGLLVVAAFALGCGVAGEKKVIATNNKVELELMFEHDGCKVYRFMDFGEPVYYADCRDGNQHETPEVSMNWRHMVGKVSRGFQSTTVQK